APPLRSASAAGRALRRTLFQPIPRDARAADQSELRLTLRHDAQDHARIRTQPPARGFAHLCGRQLPEALEVAVEVIGRARVEQVLVQLVRLATRLLELLQEAHLVLIDDTLQLARL